MKIKTWLLISYLVVMILPLIAAYMLFAWINSYNNDQKVAEFIETSSELQELKEVLNDPSLFEPADERIQNKLEEMSTQQRTMTLYNTSGHILYSTNPLTSGTYPISKSQLYEGLYELEQGYRIHSYKAPVFNESELVGFYEIELSREAWVSAVSNRSVLMISLFLGFFIFLYFIVIKLVNRKLNKRLLYLKEEMTAFAKGSMMEETGVNKDEIGQLKRNFYEMRDQINAAQAHIEQEQNKKQYMIAAISHDLKTPLTSIKAYAESLDVTEQLSQKEQEEYREVIIEKSNFMRQMLDDLMTYTLLQSPTYDMELVEVDGDEFFDMLVSDYEGLCMKKDIQLHKSCHVKGAYMVNPKQMMRVADNLMSNAVQHTTIGSDVWITAISSKKDIPDWLFDFAKQYMQMDVMRHVYFIVQNEGEGISTDKLEQIFEPLYQADLSRNKKDDHGTGLGLSITKQIMNKHDGNVKVLSKENRGTTVICSLPKINEAREENEV